MPTERPPDIAEFELDSPLTPKLIHARVRELLRNSQYEGESSSRGFLIRKVTVRRRVGHASGPRYIYGPWIEGELDSREEGTLIHLMVKIGDYLEHERWKHSMAMIPWVVVSAVGVWGAFRFSRWVLLLLPLLLLLRVAFREPKPSPENVVQEIAPILTGEGLSIPDFARSRM